MRAMGHGGLKESHERGPRAISDFPVGGDRMVVIGCECNEAHLMLLRARPVRALGQFAKILDARRRRARLSLDAP